MKTKLNFLVVLILLAILVVVNAGAVQAQRPWHRSCVSAERSS